jgi:hypothetical protein
MSTEASPGGVARLTGGGAGRGGAPEREEPAAHRLERLAALEELPRLRTKIRAAAGAPRASATAGGERAGRGAGGAGRGRAEPERRRRTRGRGRSTSCPTAAPPRPAQRAARRTGPGSGRPRRGGSLEARDITCWKKPGRGWKRSVESPPGQSQIAPATSPAAPSRTRQQRAARAPSRAGGAQRSKPASSRRLRSAGKAGAPLAAPSARCTWVWVPRGLEAQP